MKKSWLTLISILSLNFASAYSYGYGGYSFSQILDSIDPSTAILGALFLIAFIFINFALERYLKNKTISAVASFCISFLLIYILNKNLDVYSIIYNFGWYSEELSGIFFLIFAAIFVVTGFSYGWGIAMVVLGFLSILAGIINFFEMSLGITLGIILIVIGGFIAHKWPRKKSNAEAIGDFLKK